jgi:pimeloyl-ACP methyl ester carboxylesterase
VTDRYDVIMFDACGHGLSDPPTAADRSTSGQDPAGLIKALKLDKPI